MKQPTHERSIRLRQSSWELLDEAASLWDGSPDEILDSLVQQFHATDNGEAVSRADCLAKLRSMFGKNRG